MARRRGRRPRRPDRRDDRHASPAGRAGCCGDLLRPTAARSSCCVVAVLVENAARLSIPLLVAKGIDVGIPPIRERRRPRAAAGRSSASCSSRRSSRRSRATSSWCGPGRSARTSCSRSGSACSGTSSGSARRSTTRYTSGPGDLAADLRRRRDLRDARDRLRRPDHRGADPGRHRRCCCSSSTCKLGLVALLCGPVPGLG